MWYVESFIVGTDSLAVVQGLSSGRAWAQLLRSTWDPSSLIRDQTHIPCIARQTQPRDHQGSPGNLFFINVHVFLTNALVSHVAD